MKKYKKIRPSFFEDVFSKDMDGCVKSVEVEARMK